MPSTAAIETTNYREEKKHCFAKYSDNGNVHKEIGMINVGTLNGTSINTSLGNATLWTNLLVGGHTNRLVSSHKLLVRQTGKEVKVFI